MGSISSHVKAGVQIDKFRSSPDDIRTAVQAVVEEKEYRRNAKGAAKAMTRNAAMRLDFLGARLDGVQRVGVPVAAAIIEKAMAGEDPMQVLPEELRPSA